MCLCVLMCAGGRAGPLLFRAEFDVSLGQMFFFFFSFVHVAQLSIALGRHTLPHVRV